MLCATCHETARARLLHDFTLLETKLLMPDVLGTVGNVVPRLEALLNRPSLHHRGDPRVR